MQSKVKLISAIFFCLGLVLSVLLAQSYQQIENESLMNEFRRDCDSQVSHMDREISVHLEILYALKALYDGSTEVSGEDFHLAAKTFLSRHKAIQALEWIPHVGRDQRTLFEDLRKVTHPHFQFTERKAQGEMTRAIQREDYFPVYFVEPYKGNEQALGFDVASNESRLQTLLKASRSGEAAASPPITLVQEIEKKQKGMVIFLPVFRRENKGSLHGFIAGVFRINDIAKKSLLKNRDLNIALSLWDETSSPAIFLYKNKNHGIKIKKFHYRKKLQSFAGRNFSVSFSPSQDYLDEHRGITTYLIFILSLIVSAIGSVYLRKSLEEKHRIKQTVEEQTGNLANSEERFRLAMHATAEGIFEWRFGSHDFYFSPGFITMLGYEEGELPKSVQTWKDLIHPDDFESAWAELENLLSSREGKLKTMYRMRCKNGKFRHVQMMAQILEKSYTSHETCIVGTHTDIEKHVAYEKKLLLARQEAEEANEAKSEFLAHMSHEIRTPMNAILGFSNLLSKRVVEPKNKEYIEAISSASRSLLRLINDILDLSKVEAGKITLEQKATNPHILIADLEQVFSVRIAEKDLDFSIFIDPTLPNSLCLDGTRVMQILFNLLSNAIKFTDHGSIDIAVGCQHHEGKLDLVIKVQDTGNGIPADEQEKIFESFEQVKRQSYEKYGGTGLGLSISQNLAHMMGGEVTLESKVSEGSCFTLTLPNISLSKEQDLEQKLREHPDEYYFKDAKVLIVDDVFLNRELIASYLRETGLDTVLAGDGQEALEAAKEQNFDLILMDLRMPRLDGFSAAKKIKEFSDVPIILVSAQCKKTEYLEFSEGFLNKPVRQRDLLHEISLFLEEGEPVEVKVEAPQKNIVISEEMHQMAIRDLKALQGEVDRIKDQMTINEISSLIAQVKVILDEYPIESLQLWYANLQESFTSFDMHKTSDLLHDFSKLHE